MDRGLHVGVVDFDGPRSSLHAPEIECVTQLLLEQKIKDLSHPFGHGYVVAAGLLGIKPLFYTQAHSPK